MNPSDLKELLAEGRFSPFVVTTNDGYALAIGPEQQRHIVVGKRMFVTVDSDNNIVHIPYNAIAHITEPN